MDTGNASRVRFHHERLDRPVESLALVTPATPGGSLWTQSAAVRHVVAVATALSRVDQMQDFVAEFMAAARRALSAEDAVVVARGTDGDLTVAAAMVQEMAHVPVGLIDRAIREHAAASMSWNVPSGSLDGSGGVSEMALLCCPISPRRARERLVCLLWFARPLLDRELQLLAVLAEVSIAMHDNLHRHIRMARCLEADKKRLASGPALSFSDPSCRAFNFAIDKAAKLATPVLIAGERGTLKRQIARSLHESSNRRRHPFVGVDCRIPEALHEVMLFGYEPGTFTASQPRGDLELAEDGTLYLANVERLDASVQKRLSQFLHDGRVRRIGAASSRRVDVRLVAGTSVDLAVAVERGAFLESLYLAFRTSFVDVPPLRLRPRDIRTRVLLVIQRSWTHNAPHQTVMISEDAMGLLLQYDWPGNDWELEFVVQRAIILAAGSPIRPEHFPGLSLG